jgi:hypothetical protein
VHIHQRENRNGNHANHNETHRSIKRIRAEA